MIIIDKRYIRQLQENTENVDITKNPNFKKWFGNSKVNEKFAELFALSHFNYKGQPFDKWNDKVEKFKEIMS